MIAGHIEDGPRRVIMGSKGSVYQGEVVARAPWPSTSGNVCYYAPRSGGNGGPGGVREERGSVRKFQPDDLFRLEQIGRSFGGLFSFSRDRSHPALVLQRGHETVGLHKQGILRMALVVTISVAEIACLRRSKVTTMRSCRSHSENWSGSFAYIRHR